VPRKLSGLI